jgi:hypothetical protein
MSGPSHNSSTSGHGHGGPGEAADAVRYDLVVGVGVVSLIIFAVSIWWASMIWRGTMHDTEAKAGRAREFDRSRTEIGIVDQVPFVSDQRLHGWRADRKWELEHYGWVDKARGVVRMPIDEAMSKVAAGALPAGAPK